MTNKRLGRGHPSLPECEKATHSELLENSEFWLFP
jgi:hypothetical protein